MHTLIYTHTHTHTHTGLYLELGAMEWKLTAMYHYRTFPSALANLSKVDVVIKDSYAKLIVNLKLVNSVMLL